MKFALTFNKPAVNNFIDPAQHAGIRVKVEDGVIYFKATKSEKGNGVFPITTRTRGGLGIEMSGKLADDFLKQTGLERGSHMKVLQTTYGWLYAEPMNAVGEKPSKIHPCARLWRAIDEMGTKAEKAPVKAKRAPRAASRAKKADAAPKAKRGGRRSQAAQEVAAAAV